MKACSVLPLPLQPGLGGEGKGLAEVSAHICGARRVPGQHGIPLGDVTLSQSLPCHCLPGANQLPLWSGEPQNHSVSD